MSRASCHTTSSLEQCHGFEVLPSWIVPTMAGTTPILDVRSFPLRILPNFWKHLDHIWQFLFSFQVPMGWEDRGRGRVIFLSSDEYQDISFNSNGWNFSRFYLFFISFWISICLNWNGACSIRINLFFIFCIFSCDQLSYVQRNLRIKTFLWDDWNLSIQKFWVSFE